MPNRNNLSEKRLTSRMASVGSVPHGGQCGRAEKLIS